MLIYSLVFLVALIYLYIAKATETRSSMPLAIFLLFLALFVGLGDMIGGYDRYVYGNIFDVIADETRSKRNYRSLLHLVNGSEYGYFVWNIIVSFFTANRYVFILSGTLLMYVLYFRGIKMYMTDYPLACIIFLGFLYYFTITYMRQTIAVGIIWQSVKYIWERQPINFFALVLLAFFFHSSALIFAVMYFVPIRKHSKSTIIFVLLGIFLLSATPLPSILMSNAGNYTNMESRVGSYTSQGMVGFRWDYVLEVIVLITILFRSYEYIPDDKKTLTFLNAYIVFCCVILFYIRFGQGGRIGWHFFIGIIYILSSIPNYNKEDKAIKPIVIILCFTLFIRITVSWAFNLVPYKTFLTNGQPSGERWIYQQYEYDKKYTKNKFYR